MENKQNIIARYIAIALRQYELYEKGEPSVKESDELGEIARGLYKKNELGILYPLLSHKHSHVKYCAAMHLLPLYKEECMNVLKHLAESDMTLTGFDAKWTLKNYESGRYEDDFFF